MYIILSNYFTNELNKGTKHNVTHPTQLGLTPIKMSDSIKEQRSQNDGISLMIELCL